MMQSACRTGGELGGHAGRQKRVDPGSLFRLQRPSCFFVPDGRAVYAAQAKRFTFGALGTFSREKRQVRRVRALALLACLGVGAGHRAADRGGLPTPGALRDPGAVECHSCGRKATAVLLLPCPLAAPASRPLSAGGTTSQRPAPGTIANQRTDAPAHRACRFDRMRRASKARWSGGRAAFFGLLRFGRLQSTAGGIIMQTAKMPPAVGPPRPDARGRPCSSKCRVTA